MADYIIKTESTDKGTGLAGIGFCAADLLDRSSIVKRKENSLGEFYCIRIKNEEGCKFDTICRKDKDELEHILSEIKGKIIDNENKSEPLEKVVVWKGKFGFKENLDLL